MGNVRLRLKDKATGFNYDIKPANGVILEDAVIEIPTYKDGVLLTMETLIDGGNSLVNEYSKIKAPSILSPLNGDLAVTGWFSVNEFINEGSIPLVFVGVKWQIANDPLFEDIIYSKQVDYVYTNNPVLLTANKKLYVRASYVLDKLTSEWSEPVEFTTGTAFVSTPEVTVTENLAGEDIFRTRVTTSSFNITGMAGTHSSTTWRVIDMLTNTVVEEVINGDKVKFDINLNLLTKGKVYKIEAIHNATSGISLNGYTYYKFDRKVLWIGPDLNWDLLGESGSSYYFGEVGIDQLDGTYNYRGEWGINSGRPDKDYTKDEQVTYNDVLYRCVRAHTNVTPGTDATTWVVDTRNNLPTGKWLLDQVGIGYGLTDNNVDGRSSGSVKLGNLKNNDQGWLKYLHNGKLIYIAKKPWCDTIAWTDIAKREAESGKRTIRIGRHLYYVRLVKQDEFNNCLVKITDGSMGNYTTLDVSLTDKCWIHDMTEGGYRSRTNGSTGIENGITISRTGSYRPVLEYIPVGQEPYNNIKSGIPMATNENFQYDFYTDTGYFGHVPATSLIGGTSLATNIGLTAGTAQNDTTGYFKFYWHGQILYVCKQTIRHTVSWVDHNAVNCVFGKDMGGSGKKTITVGSNTYAVQLLLGAGKSPVDDGVYWSDSGTNTEAVFNRNVNSEIGRGSQWNDLMYRVHTVIPSNRWVDQTDGTTIYKNLTGGVQIGKNWASYTNADMSVCYTQGGNGTAFWCQEVSQAGINAGRIGRGTYRLASMDESTSSSANANSGSRLSLRLL